jgi:hypothetical protein
MRCLGRSYEMSWIKKYAISCLIAMFVLAAGDACRHPGKDVRFGAIAIVAAGWPIVLSIAVGSTVGDMFREPA